ncbi:hypothetical protein UFOVP1614_4 [uncultured Caudovirales phage]|uniref:Uncharacterized protein n=1 Tax=uncultured Caudovirales phage TaxID=2100421 RepID=A0A6J5R862_9CAUD|nr:hypothetical protein UFOVP508_18 [uncultured Caudovirales phage]CAB4178093.1 hypothetical protein UFOVP1012_25 [uncultured Caudovirales phage]CAB4187874.1 hypothetical protein UFOVP1164_20 [uncultured Caudovirales phage]CAB4219347.1 hypothetical protein UFOVP1614_4 [uncultured Caudovirales phage]
MKLCKDCKHFDNTKLLVECKRPIGISLVTGEPKFRKITAEHERELDVTGCGTQAKYFEIKDENYDLVDPPTSLDAIKYKKTHDCKRSGCTVCVAFDH